MKRLGVLVVLLVFLGCGCRMREAVMQREPAREMSARDLLPGSAEVPNWKRSDDVRVFSGKGLYDYIDGAGEIFVKYDFREVATSEYEHAQTGDLIAIDVYDMGSANEAFGIYSYSRYPGAEFLDAGNEAFVTETSLDFWEGRFYVKVQAFQVGDETTAAMKEFSQWIAGRIPDEGWNPPAVLALLPSDGLAARSEKFFHEKLILDNLVFISEENTFDLSADTDSAWAEYDDGGERAKVLFVAYPSGSAAEAVVTRLAEGRRMPDGKKSGVWAMSGIEIGGERVGILYFRKVVGVIWGGSDGFRQRVTLFFIGQISKAREGGLPDLSEVLGL